MRQVVAFLEPERHVVVMVSLDRAADPEATVRRVVEHYLGENANLHPAGFGWGDLGKIPTSYWYSAGVQMVVAPDVVVVLDPHEALLDAEEEVLPGPLFMPKTLPEETAP